MIQKWRELKKRTWKDFIFPFVMLKKCVKAKELAKEHSVYFYDMKELNNCKDINNHAEL